MEWDVFISHASEDKDSVARPLADLLRSRGLRVWLDEQELLLGDSVRGMVDEGLAHSTWGVVVLSQAFLAKQWPQAELDALFSREMNGQKVLLPVWHGVTAEDIARRAPLLAARLAVDTRKGLHAVCVAILRATRHPEVAGTRPPPAEPRDLADVWNAAPIAGVRAVDGLARRPELYDGYPVGPYVLHEFIGSGGTGVVFKATHRLFGRTVALKLFYPTTAEQRVLLRATETAVRGLATLRSPNIVTLLDFGYVDFGGRTSAYLVNELLLGPDLQGWANGLGSDPADFKRKLDAAIKLADALQLAHSCTFVGELGFAQTGVFHGDIKSSNIIVQQDDEPVITDFMLPDLQRLAQGPGFRRWSGREDEVRHGEFTRQFGTPNYMAPEQEKEGIVTATSDVYSLGVTLAGGLFNWRLGGDEPWRRDLAMLLSTMRNEMPEQRPQSMQEVARALRAIRALRP